MINRSRKKRKHAIGLRNSSARRLRLESLEDRRMLATFAVSSVNDDGLGSFRQAILDANNQAGPDNIAFDEELFSTPQTIALASALPSITEAVTINGPGQNLLTLNAGHGPDNQPGTGDGFRLLDIGDDNVGSFFNVFIQGLTLSARRRRRRWRRDQ